MKMRIDVRHLLPVALTLVGCTLMMAQQAPSRPGVPPARPQGTCDVYAAAGDSCAAAHSTTRALYASYNGPLYQVLRQSDGKTLDIGVVQAVALPVPDGGGYADSPAQDRFCANTYCWITKVYDQSPKHNDLTQAPRGGFSGPALGGFNNVPLADMAPISISGHKVYGVFIAPGMGLRHNDVRGTAVDDQAEGQYWVVNGKHFNSGCCFDYGNAEIDSRDDDNGTMETAYFGNATPWYSGSGVGPWIMTDQENNLVGCVKQDGSKGCTDLPSIPFRFVTAIAKGEPHRWASLGGDAQKGSLSVMFDGPRVNPTYDPMRKQGAILLGNGGDNSDGSQGTFYEGAITEAGSFPSDATDQLVQTNIVAARYDVAPLAVAPGKSASAPPGLQTFTPGSSQETVVTFTNITSAPVAGLVLGLSVPSGQWTAVVSRTSETSKTFDQPIVPGGSVSAAFKVTAGPAAFQGDLVGHASWTNANGSKQVETVAEKVRNTSPIKINEYRVRSGAPANPTNSFIELYNAGSKSVDLSNWTLTEHPAHQAIFSAIKIPAGTTLAAGAFYLLGLSDSGLAVPARAGESTLHVRNTEGMSVGDTIRIGEGSSAETRRIASVGSAASDGTTVWQPLPEGPVITIDAGATNVPVESVAGFSVGQTIALGYGTTYPAVANTVEQYEIATVTAVGKPGTQAYLAMDARAGASSIKVTSVSDISVGDKIRLDVDSVGHGIETVTVAHVGTAATKTNLSANASAGATRVNVRRAEGFAVGDKITIGTPASQEGVTITAIGNRGRGGVALDFTPALAKPHGTDEWVVSPGTGLDLGAPLQHDHAANLPFSNRGTGISFHPATAFAHSSNEPVQAPGTGITVDKPLNNTHAIHEVVRDEAVKTAGYQGPPAPNQWFGGPELTTNFPIFGRTITIEEGSMVLRDASGVVADSLNYGAIADPWAAEGYQAASGANESGCYAPAPGSTLELWSVVPGPVATNTSGGRYPDGADTDSNCNDFLTQAAASLSTASPAGATNIKVDSVEGFSAGQKVLVDSGANLEDAIIAAVGTAGATTVRNATEVGATVLAAGNVSGFRKGEAITIDSGANAETSVVSAIRGFGGGTITVAAPLAREHAAGVQISGSGITLTGALARAHADGAQISTDLPTPGAPNQYHRISH
jgi:non-reducing end alpha-L-arabinofuranosidase